MAEEGFTAEEIDTSRPHPARMYDYYLGGQDNYEVDRSSPSGAYVRSSTSVPGYRRRRTRTRSPVRSPPTSGSRTWTTTRSSACTTDALPAGSHLILSHGTADFDDGGDDRTSTAVKVYKSSTANLTVRTQAQIAAFFKGFDLLEPGLVQPSFWRPDRPVPDDPTLRRLGGYCGVGVRP